MANVNATYQQVHTVSVKREKLIDIGTNLDLNKKDLRLFIILLTQLDGYTEPKRQSDRPDPLNYKRIDIASLADVLSMSKKEVKKSLDKLMLEGYIEDGSNDTIKDGYRFTF